jgi:hypothetical protein
VSTTGSSTLPSMSPENESLLFGEDKSLTLAECWMFLRLYLRIFLQMVVNTLPCNLISRDGCALWQYPREWGKEHIHRITSWSCSFYLSALNQLVNLCTSLFFWL